MNPRALIPIEPGGKRPLVAWREFQHRPATEEEIAAWHARWPEANWALVTGAVSGVIVVDSDARRNGEDALRGRALPPTRTVATPGGGLHRYYAHPGGLIPCVPDLLPGVDLKADGGYVLVPPSAINGRAYEVVIDEPPAPIPDWLQELLLARAAARDEQRAMSGDETATLLRGVGEGTRNSTATRLAGHYLALKLAESEVVELLAAWNTRNRPPLAVDEIRAVVASIARAETRKCATLQEETREVLEQVRSFIRRYVVLTESQLTAVALWAAHTWTVDSVDTTPYLAITSPTMRAGKSRLLETLELLVRAPLRTANTSVAALFRTLAAERTTLLLDEADAIFRAKGEHEDLRALLNAGYQRGAVVARCESDGKRIHVVRYDAFSPKAIAAIGDLPGTVTDRSILLRMKRRTHAESLAKFRARKVKSEAAPLRQQLEAWSAAAQPMLREAEPEVPAELDDRAQDCWSSLLSIADLAAGEWGQRSRAAALDLAGAPAREDDSIRVRLLADIRRVFEERGADRLATADLIDGLCEDDSAPWGDLRGKRMTPQTLARLLRPFDVRPGTVWLDGGRTAKGWKAEDFKDAWARYLPLHPSGPSGSSTDAASSHFFDPSGGGGLTDAEKAANPRPDCILTHLTDKTPQKGEEAGVGPGDGGQTPPQDEPLPPRIQRAVELFDAVVLDVRDAPGEVPPAPCRACGGGRWWQSIHGPVICGICHPPADPNLVARWWGEPPPPGKGPPDGWLWAADGEFVTPEDLAKGEGAGQLVLRVGEATRWKSRFYRPGWAIAEGKAAWLRFVRTNSADEVRKAAEAFLADPELQGGAPDEDA